MKDNFKLTLNDEKILITNFSKKPITFLGVHIKSFGDRNKRIQTVFRKGVKIKSRDTGRVVINALELCVLPKCWSDALMAKLYELIDSKSKLPVLVFNNNCFHFKLCK